MAGKDIAVGGDGLGGADHALERVGLSQKFRKRFKNADLEVFITKPTDKTTQVAFFRDGRAIDVQFIEWPPAVAEEIGRAIIEATRASLPAAALDAAVADMREGQAVQ